MRIFSLIPVLAALVTTVTGVALPNQNERVARDGTSGLTNAALLRRGLPPRNPIMRRGTPIRRTKPSATPPKPPTKITYRGVIKVKRQSDGACLGYVSSTTVGNFLYQYQNISSALVVSFETANTTSRLSGRQAKSSLSQLNIVPENSDIKNFGYLGLVEGRENVDSNLAAGSFQYTYLSGTNPTPPGAAPETVGNAYSASSGVARTSESAVWNLDSASGSLSAGWVNADDSLPTVEHFAQNGAICVGGDAAAWFAKFGPDPVTRIALDFVPI